MIMISKYQFFTAGGRVGAAQVFPGGARIAARFLARRNAPADSNPSRHLALPMKLPGLLLLAGLLLAGCSTVETHFEPDASLGRFKRIYVQQNLNDNHGLDVLIVRELQDRGLQAESGPLTLMPRDVKVYLTYDDHWDWDFKNYLISLGMTVRDATTDRPLASATYFRPTAFLKTPRFMVRTVLDKLLNPPTRSHPPSKPAPADSPKTGR